MYNFIFGYLEDLHDALPEITDIKERFEHTYIIGKTGMGKSSILERMSQYDIDYGLATIFIDPKGDSVKKLYHLTKDKSRIKYISIESPIIINPLNKEGYKLDNLVQEFIQILDILVTLTASNPESIVLMREIILMAMHAITKEEDRNLDYLTKFLLYPAIRKELLVRLDIKSDAYIYWKEFDQSNKDKVECAKRVASRLVEISTGEMKNFVVGKNELDISSIVENAKVLLVDTSKMNRNSRIYLTNLIVYAVLSYCEFAEKKDKPLMVYVDEFQIVVSNLFADLLARSRSSKVGFTLAHQTFHQIPRNILSDIFGTVNTQICFRCGDEEARRFAPLFGVKMPEIFNLEKYHAWLRIGTDNILIETYPPELTEVPDIAIPKEIPSQTLIPFSEPEIKIQEFNFLKDAWIKI